MIRPLYGLALAIAFLTPTILRSQSTDNASKFAVTTIHPSPPGEMFAVVVNGRRFFTKETSVKDLISYAWMVHPNQIVGGPEWLESDKFDVMAETDHTGRLAQPEARKMVQQLLADRFHLAFHPGRKELSIYALVAANEMPKKLTASPGDANGFGTVGFTMLGEMAVKNATMAEFANFLQRYVLDRPVLDQSAIEGRYDLKLDWTADESQFHGRGAQLPAPDRAVEPPDLFTAIHAQLGLRLVPKKDLAPVLVIDRAEKPGEN